MNKKVTSILSYCTFIGWLVAFIGGDRYAAKEDLNQGFILGVAGITLALTGAFVNVIVPFNFIRTILNLTIWSVELGVGFLSVMGIIFAAMDREFQIPIIKDIRIFK